MDIGEIEETIGHLVSTVVKFDESHESIDLSSYIGAEQYELFHTLANTYEGRLKKAESAVKEAEKEAFKGVRPKEYDLVNFNVYHCYECDHDTMIPNERSSTGYKCTFCENEESEDIEKSCEVCSMPWPVGEMWYTDWAGDGHNIYVCPHCRYGPE